MNKNNVVDLQQFIKDKRAVAFEQVCLDMVDHMAGRAYIYDCICENSK